MAGNRRFHAWGIVPRGSSLVLSALMVVTPVSGARAADDSSAAPNAVIAVVSDPVGANVYIDGRFVGQTPIHVDKLSAGDHRVRVVKAGFLENGRIVNVGAGKRSTVQVKLTPDTTGKTNAQVIGRTTTSDDGGFPTWGWYAIAGGAAATAAVLLVNRNNPPIAGTVSVSPGTSLQGTNVTLTSQGASDPDGDPLTYVWDFGDGSSGTGQSVTKVYTTSGALNVRVTVSDGKKDATATGTANVRSLSGTWRGDHPFYGTTTIALTQTNTTFSGSWADPFGPGTVTGTVSTAAPNIRLTVNFPGFTPGLFQASPNGDVSSLSGTYSEAGVSVPFTIARQ